MDEPFDEELDAAARKIQRLARTRSRRVSMPIDDSLEISETAEEEEDRIDSGWGFDTSHDPLSNNVLTKAPPRMIDSFSSLPLDFDISQTIIQDYQGEFDGEGRYNGQGRATFVNGNTFNGGWLDGLMHGQGIFTWENGTIYRGLFVNGKIQGKGSLRWPCGNTYDGDVLAGYRHGRGKFVMVTSSDEFEDENGVMTYDGEWYGGKKHGVGTLLYRTDGKERYEGEWRNDAKCGHGLMVCRPSCPSN
jgi:hypothetical protein